MNKSRFGKWKRNYSCGSATSTFERSIWSEQRPMRYWPRSRRSLCKLLKVWKTKDVFSTPSTIRTGSTAAIKNNCQGSAVANCHGSAVTFHVRPWKKGQEDDEPRRGERVFRRYAAGELRARQGSGKKRS